MAFALAIACAGFTEPVRAAAHAKLAAPPAGATLPVVLQGTLDADHATPGQSVRARVSQRVPLGGGNYLPNGAELAGTVEKAGANQLALEWTKLSWHGQDVALHVRLIAAAASFDVEQTKIPLGGPTGRSTSDWTTRQVGGDELVGVNVPATVYDQYSQPVGRADGTGVYAPAARPGGLERAMGSFSTTAKGLYGLAGWTIVSLGDAGGPMVLGVPARGRKLGSGAAMLLQVVAP